MFRRSVTPLATFTWLAGAVVGVACNIPDYDARETSQSGGEGGENVGGVSGTSTTGGVTNAGNGTMGGSSGSSTRGGSGGATSTGGSGGSGKGGAGDGGESGSNGGGAGSGAAGKGGAGNGGAAGKGGAGNGGAGNTGGAGSGGAGNTGGAGSGGAVNGGAGSGGAAGKGGAGSGGAAGKGGAGNGGAGNGGAGNGGAGNGGAGNGGAGGGPRCFTPNSNNLVPNPGFDTSSIGHFISQDAYITHSRSTLDATNCASSGSLAVTNSAPNGLNISSVYCITSITPGETYNVGGWMMEPSGYAVGQVFLQFGFTDGPDCSGNFVGETISLQGPSVADTWESARRDGWVTPIGAVSLGVHVKALKNLPDTLPYRAYFDMLYVTPVPGLF